MINKITLDVLGKTDFSFGLGFLGDLLDETNLTIDGIIDKLNKNPFKMIPVLMYQSAKYAAMRKGDDLLFKQYELMDWIDENGGVQNDGIVKFMDAFTKSLTKDVPKEKEVKQSKEEAKKKLTGELT